MNDETTKADASLPNTLLSLVPAQADNAPSAKTDQLADVLNMALECLAVASGHIEKRPKGLLFSQPEKLAMSKILTVMEKLCEQMGVL